MHPYRVFTSNLAPAGPEAPFEGTAAKAYHRGIRTAVPDIRVQNSGKPCFPAFAGKGVLGQMLSRIGMAKPCAARSTGYGNPVAQSINSTSPGGAVVEVADCGFRKLFPVGATVVSVDCSGLLLGTIGNEDESVVISGHPSEGNDRAAGYYNGFRQLHNGPVGLYCRGDAGDLGRFGPNDGNGHRAVVPKKLVWSRHTPLDYPDVIYPHGGSNR